jgi:hypothetical protein
MGVLGCQCALLPRPLPPTRPPSEGIAAAQQALMEDPDMEFNVAHLIALRDPSVRALGCLRGIRRSRSGLSSAAMSR